ncbi:hypothetical protein [Mycolicibacterium fortuitum]|uniref:hypothetical protein n=1 Tax=Mycolicibacterium fortuitum TaxID=1766 RepID=UPI0026082200|nr:hypothetical protein [Mycolicibacterium fortuitum]
MSSKMSATRATTPAIPEDAHQRDTIPQRKTIIEMVRTLLNDPLEDVKPQKFLSGREAKRARRRGVGEHRPERSRCQRSAKKRGVRKVRS